jgi:hypothetical protein
MLRLSDRATAPALDKIMHGLADLVDRLEGCSGFCAGPNRDYEGKSPDVDYGFTFDAKNAKALAAYAVHPDHLELGAKLVALCKDGAEGIIVYDLEVPR